MKLLAVSVFMGLALIAVALVLERLKANEMPNYSGYEEVLESYGTGTTNAVQLHGPFYRVLYRTAEGEPKCYLVDVSTQYQGKGGADGFWAAEGRC